MTFSKFIRRTHMYMGLFFAPWMLIYALSTIAMNHRDWLSGFYSETPVFEREVETEQKISLPQDASAREQASVLLSVLDMEGAFSAQQDETKLIVHRNHAIHPKRITYDRENGHLLIERQVFESPRFLERMHRRRGFQQESLLEDLWALSVDLVIVTIILWGLSGIWMWWELKVTRVWGLVSVILGVSLFGLFLFTI